MYVETLARGLSTLPSEMCALDVKLMRNLQTA